MSALTHNKPIYSGACMRSYPNQQQRRKIQQQLNGGYNNKTTNNRHQSQAPSQKRSRDTTSGLSPVAATAVAPTWASLFASQAQSSTSLKSEVTSHSDTSPQEALQTTGTASKKVKPEPALQPLNYSSHGDCSLKLANILRNYNPVWAQISLRPRGLTNRSNYCYINSTLQALLGCVPLYNLVRAIPTRAALLCAVKTPAINSMISFMRNFSNLPMVGHLHTNKAPKSHTSGTQNNIGTHFQSDGAFEPTEIYKLWNESRADQLFGRQEDAEEFLSFMLNKLNDEMREICSKAAFETLEKKESGGALDFGNTPLSDIFRGELRSRLQREGEQHTDTMQPFFTLQLNIKQSASVKEALEFLVKINQLEGLTASESKQKVMATQQFSLQKLPVVLVLHLQCFDYLWDGPKKILKKFQFPFNLTIDTKTLAPTKYTHKQRAYRLFAVTYHEGKEATRGHYLSDVYHAGYGSWLRCNDRNVNPVSEYEVLNPASPRVPYLLYYQRRDTLSQNGRSVKPSSTFSRIHGG